MVNQSPAAPFDVEHLYALANTQNSILNTLPIGLTAYEIVSPSEWRMSYINKAGLRVGSHTQEQAIGTRFEELIPPESLAKTRRYFQKCLDTGEMHIVEDSYQLEHMLLWTRSTFAPIRNDEGKITHLLAFWEDITERKLREQQEREQQEEIIRRQQATLAELSTPLLSISENTVVMPLIGAVDSQRVQQLMDALLSGVSESRATNVILDITGVPVVDTQVANAFLRASQAVSLLGCRVVLTGIRPEVAQTLVGLGVDLRTIITRGTLRDGITYALNN